jgi:hypothetical protein
MGNKPMTKNQLLQELWDIRSAAPGSWIIAGDFNLIYKAEVKNNNNYNRAIMGRFRRLINDFGLKGIPLHSRKFTWSNHRANPTGVLGQGLLHLLQSAASEDSDHCPLLLCFDGNKSFYLVFVGMIFFSAS